MRAATLVLCAALLAACADGITYSTSASDRLTFSADTVAFGTVISGQVSATHTLVAFNRNSQGLRITNVTLDGGDSSRFMVNVDGEYLYDGQGADFQVLGRDSIYVRLAVTLPEADSDELVAYEDRLVFTLESGATQAVTLTASGMDVVAYTGEVVDFDAEFNASRPYLIRDSLVVAQGITLTLPAGCTMMFHDSTSLVVRGTLIALGTVEQPVTLRGDRTDNMFDYLPYDNTPNRWGGVRFMPGSRGDLTQVDIHAGDYGIVADSLSQLCITNSVIHNVGGDGLQLLGATATVVGTQVSNALGNCVTVLGGATEFTHCTMAQFYPFSSARGCAVSIANTSGDVYWPMAWCRFTNCVITGYADDELMGEIAEDEDNPVDYSFRNCLLRTPAVQGEERFDANVYDLPDSLDVTGSQHFALFDTDNFLYDFAPDSLSAIRGLADPAAAAQHPWDRRGVSRLADGAPDAGAYEGY